MVTINAQGIQQFDAEAGKRLVLAIEDAGIDILHRCGGNAKCTTCRVEILAGDAGAMTPKEQDRLSRVDSATETTRLSCQILIENDLTIHVDKRLSETDMSDAGPRPEDELDLSEE
ncbi:MAG: 2Fe-2S iron-sulfur cluster-binding protein [Thermomicrobiales bacterium]